MGLAAEEGARCDDDGLAGDDLALICAVGGSEYAAQGRKIIAELTDA